MGNTTAGLNNLLEIEYRSGTQITSWYVGFIDSTGYSAVAATDTPSSHSGWSEFTSYSESTRQQWSPAAASGGALANTTAITITPTANCNLVGVFLISNSTKGGTTGVLRKTILFPSTYGAAAGQPVQVFITDSGA